MTTVPREVFGVVYRVTHSKDPNRVRYVGQTIVGVLKRRQAHWYAARSGVDLPMSRWLRSNLKNPEEVTFEIESEHFSREELDQAEIKSIESHRSRNMCDLNIANGGSGLSGYERSAEANRKSSEALRGEGSWKHVLKWGDVREIRKRSLSGERIKDIIRDYPVDESTVGHVVRNTTWVDPDYHPRDVTKYPRRLTRDEIRVLRDEAKKEKHTAIYWSDEWGISNSRVTRILSNITAHDPKYDPSGVLPDSAEAHSGLTWPDVEEIRRHRSHVRETNTVTGSRYGVPEAVIKKVLNNWTFVDPEFDKSLILTVAPGSWVSKLTQLDADAIRNLRQSTWVGLKEIADEYGVSTSTIKSVLDNRTYPDPCYSKESIVPFSGKLEEQ